MKLETCTGHTRRPRVCRKVSFYPRIPLKNHSGRTRSRCANTLTSRDEVRPFPRSQLPKAFAPEQIRTQGPVGPLRQGGRLLSRCPVHTRAVLSSRLLAAPQSPRTLLIEMCPEPAQASSWSHRLLRESTSLRGVPRGSPCPGPLTPALLPSPPTYVLVLFLSGYFGTCCSKQFQTPYLSVPLSSTHSVPCPRRLGTAGSPHLTSSPAGVQEQE